MVLSILSMRFYPCTYCKYRGRCFIGFQFSLWDSIPITLKQLYRELYAVFQFSLWDSQSPLWGEKMSQLEVLFQFSLWDSGWLTEVGSAEFVIYDFQFSLWDSQKRIRQQAAGVGAGGLSILSMRFFTPSAGDVEVWVDTFNSLYEILDGCG